MRSTTLLSLAVGLCLAASAAAQGTKSGNPAAASHNLLRPADIKWGPAPAVLRKGAQIAVLAGDPGATGPYTVRLKLPAGYKIAPHWHPTDENVTVLAGTFSLGMGETYDLKSLKVLPVGGYAVLPAEMRPFAFTKSGATVQVHGTGPFVINYVNAAD